MSNYWFKADIGFVCPRCKRYSVETVLADDNNHDQEAVARAIRERVRPLICQNQKCKAMWPDGVAIEIGLNDLTPEELAKLKVLDSPPRKLT